MAVLDTPPDVLTAEQAAAFIGVRPNTLAVWRMTGRNDLPFFKVGRLARYRRKDLERWVSERCGTSNSAIEAALA